MSRKPATPRTRPVEWWLAGISGALLLAAVGYLAWVGLSDLEPVPLVAVTAGEPRPGPAGFLVPFTARNDGGAAAAGVRVVGELDGRAGGAAERSEAVLDYVPPGSTRSGWLGFAQDPAGRHLSIRVGGETEP